MPIYLAALGPRNLRLAGELADGWLAMFFSPEHADEPLEPPARGQRSEGRRLDGFDVAATVPIVVGSNIGACADVVRDFVRCISAEWEAGTATSIRILPAGWDSPRWRTTFSVCTCPATAQAAAAAVPLDFIDRTCLLGPVERIAERLGDYASAGSDDCDHEAVPDRGLLA